MAELVIRTNAEKRASFIEEYKVRGKATIDSRMADVWEELTKGDPWHVALQSVRMSQAYAYLGDDAPDPELYPLIMESMPFYGTTPQEVAAGFIEEANNRFRLMNSVSLQKISVSLAISGATELAHVDTFVDSFINGTEWVFGR